MNFRFMIIIRTLLILSLYAPLAQSEPQANIVLSEPKPGEHWVWVADFQNGTYARSILYNADSNEILGMVDMGWEGIKLDFPRSGNELYSHAMFMSRGYRGKRTDVVTAYDKYTLNPLREIEVPAKAVRGWPDPNHTALTPDGRFLLIQFTTPASSIGVVDLKKNRYVGEIQITGCHHVMEAGLRQFFTLCGDGSVLLVKINKKGKELSRKRYPGFFDAEKDPIHGSGTRAGNNWYFVSHHGVIHTINIVGQQLKFAETWSVSRKENDKTWVPGAFMQSLAIHKNKGSLYLAMHASDLKPKGGGIDYHRQAGEEIWIFDLDSKKRLRRFPVIHPAGTIAISQDTQPMIYVSSLLHGMFTAYSEESGVPVNDLSIPGFPTIVQPVN